jgi:hypothetical protein
MIQVEKTTGEQKDYFRRRSGPLQLRTEEGSELGDSIGEAIFRLTKCKSDCFAFKRASRKEDGVHNNIRTPLEHRTQVLMEFGSCAEWAFGPTQPKVGMSPYVFVKVGEMVLCKALQRYMLASQGLGPRTMCRIGVGDDGTKFSGVVGHSGTLKGG